MKFCQNCGAQIDDKAAMCVHCGTILQQQNPKNVVAADDAPSTGFAILSFFCTIAGFVLYAIYSGTHPQKAKSCLKGAIAGIVASFVFTFLFYIVYFVLMFAVEGALFIGL